MTWCFHFCTCILSLYHSHFSIQFRFLPTIHSTDLTLLMWFFKNSTAVTGSRYDLVDMWGPAGSGNLLVWIDDNDNNIYTAHKKTTESSWTKTGSAGVKTKVPLDRWTHIGVVITGSKIKQ